MRAWKLMSAVAVATSLIACGGGGGEEASKALEETSYYTSKPITSISISHPNACFTSSVTPVDMDGDGKKDLAMHFWCNKWDAPIGFDGPTLDIFKVYLNRGDRFEDGTIQLFGSEAVSLGGATRKVVQADFNSDGKIDLAYAVNREDGRPIGENITVAETQATVVTSTMNSTYSIDRLGDAAWYHAVDTYQTSASTRSVVFQGFSNKLPQMFSNSHDTWLRDSENLPNLSGLTFRFLKSSLDQSKDDIVITVGQNDATQLEIYTKSPTDWIKGDGFYPKVDQRTIPLIGWNGDQFLANRIEINGNSYTGAGFDDSCLLKRYPNESSIFIGKFSGRRLPEGYSGQTLKETELPIEFDLMAFEPLNGNLNKINLNLTPAISEEFFNFIYCDDINLDGYDDIVLSMQRIGGTPDIYLNNKNGGFNRMPQTIYPTGIATNGESRAILSDLDNDGISDLILFELFTSPKVINIYKGNKRLQIIN